MNYSAIDIQGNIISSDVLTKIRQEDMRFQKPADFELDRNTSVRDEIGIAWSAAQAHWKAFKLRRDRLKDHDTGTSETRNSWIIPFMRELGYQLEVSKAETLNDKSYAISHRDTQRDGFPVHIVGVNQSLDKRSEGGARLSPHALVQEYLNNCEHLYAVTTNGSFLRLLRDATRLARLSYLEFNLERMMEEELYAEFALLFRVLHATRMPQKQDIGPDSVIEFYHQEALASGTRIRERLSVAVEQSIKLLGNGLLKHPENKELRERAGNPSFNADDYYLYLLRTVYRMLFLLVIEERNLIYPAERDEDLNEKRDIYYKYYSIQRLTRLAERKVYVDPRKTDLWRSLLTTFLLFEKGFYGSKLGIQPLGAGLFSPAAIGELVTQQMDNETLLSVIRHLVMFENENKQWTRVNYADLDVEEFGSVYEGLLEYDPQVIVTHEQPNFGFVEGTRRSSSGSHYTPEELVKPLIKHSLEYVIADKLKTGKEQATDRDERLLAQQRQLLTIKVCDVACGSGHILLSAARRIGIELAVLRESMGQAIPVEQPSPTYLRQAIRDVIRHCIYGVDKNPLAVELCKVALWLEAHNPGEPLNFLDHRIKCGDAIVGLARREELQNGIATEAFKALTEAEKKEDWSKTLVKRNKKERAKREHEAKAGSHQIETTTDYKLLEETKKLDKVFDAFVNLPENTPEEIEAKQKAYRKMQNSDALNRLRTLADMQVAQFFLPKTTLNKEYLVTDGDYFRYLRGEKKIDHLKETKWVQLAHEKRFFHYFLEFPEVFAAGGFDTILGNPPFLNGLKISENYGDNLNFYLVGYYEGSTKKADLCAYFFRRSYSILNKSGFSSLISTNTISQGTTRKGGLDIILGKLRGTIVYADKSRPWPGKAAVVISMCSITKREWNQPAILNGQFVERINSLLDESEGFDGKPVPLAMNMGLSYQGSNPYGEGFGIDEPSALRMISLDPNNSQVVKPFIGGVDINGRLDKNPSRWIINFHERTFTEASKFKLPLEHVKKHVFPERMSRDEAKYPRLVQEWWKFWHSRRSLYDAIDYRNLTRVFVRSRISNMHTLDFVPSDWTYSESLVVFAFENNDDFAVYQSNIHESWAVKYASTMKTDLRYVVSGCFNTFPRPKDKIKQDGFQSTMESFHSTRDKLKETLGIGLTKIYRLFHSSESDKSDSQVNDDVNSLRRFQRQLDEGVMAAYGWEDISLRHDFHEVDSLPENDRVRYTIHPDARKEILKRLLLLNHERFEEEVAKGLHKKKDVVAYYQQKGKPIPDGTKFSDVKIKYKAPKKEAEKVEEKESVYKQTKIFEDPHLFNQGIEETSNDAVKNGSQVQLQPKGKAASWFVMGKPVKGMQTLKPESAMAKKLLGKKAGDSIDFGNGFKVLKVK